MLPVLRCVDDHHVLHEERKLLNNGAQRGTRTNLMQNVHAADLDLCRKLLKEMLHQGSKRLSFDLRACKAKFGMIVGHCSPNVFSEFGR
jgi:hypothetical protein